MAKTDRFPPSRYGPAERRMARCPTKLPGASRGRIGQHRCEHDPTPNSVNRSGHGTLSVSTVWRRYGSASTTSRRNWAAAIFPAFGTGLAKANLLVRSIAPNIQSFPSSVRNSAMSM